MCLLTAIHSELHKNECQSIWILQFSMLKTRLYLQNIRSCLQLYFMTFFSLEFFSSQFFLQIWTFFIHKKYCNEKYSLNIQNICYENCPAQSCHSFVVEHWEKHCGTPWHAYFFSHNWTLCRSFRWRFQSSVDYFFK